VVLLIFLVKSLLKQQNTQLPAMKAVTATSRHNAFRKLQKYGFSWRF
jgi:hypothetical protein